MPIEAASQDRIMGMLEATSRTFFIPISRMPPVLKEAATSAYLCLRAIDEIEDHPTLPNATKIRILEGVSRAFEAESYVGDAGLRESLGEVFSPYVDDLPAVSLDLAVWAGHAPAPIAPRIWADTAAMADRMARWVAASWRIESRADLDAYTYCVAAAVGLLMCDILAWFDGTQLDRPHAILFGRALQVTNIARNRSLDLSRGVDFYPPGWEDGDIRAYAAELLAATSDYAATLPPDPVSYFIRIPLSLAAATLDALAAGQTRLERTEVLEIVGNA